MSIVSSYWQAELGFWLEDKRLWGRLVTQEASSSDALCCPGKLEARTLKGSESSEGEFEV